MAAKPPEPAPSDETLAVLDAEMARDLSLRNQTPARKKHGPKMNSKTSPEAIARYERDLKCVDLRRANVGWDAIARQLGYSDPGHAYQRFMAFMKEYPREQVDDAREVEAQRYDLLLEAIWDQCVTPGPKQHWALDRAAKLLDQRARLMGWNKPVRQEVSVITENAVDTAIRELQTQLELRAAAAGVKLPAVQ